VLPRGWKQGFKIIGMNLKPVTVVSYPPTLIGKGIKLSAAVWVIAYLHKQEADCPCSDFNGSLKLAALYL
jgi:hypothetical protein